MSIQQMPYPPHIEIDAADIVLRAVISTFAVIAFLIPLSIETTYASKEKFIGVNVSTLLHNFFTFMRICNYCKLSFACLLVHRF